MTRVYVAVLAIFLSAPAFSFSATGHKVICELAYQQLDEQAKTTVDTLIAVKKWDNFAEACTWPDWELSEPKARKKLGTHYINVARTQTSINTQDCTQANHCLFTALVEDLENLKTADNQEDQAKSLAYIGHFVGDIHQPLHVSFANDLGGNRIIISNDIDCRQNFHSLWDDCLVRKALQNAGVGATNYKAYVQILLDANQLAGVSKGSSDFSQWANESLQISRNSNTKYCFDAQCSRPPSELIISNSYLKNQANVVEQQMLLASKRLAKLLTKTLEAQQGSSSSVSSFTLANDKQAGSSAGFVYCMLFLLFFRRFKIRE